jgi:hypothetical protein
MLNRCPGLNGNGWAALRSGHDHPRRLLSLFDEARQAREVSVRMTASEVASLLGSNTFSPV